MNINSVPNIDSYVAKYMDERGCSFEQACEELELDKEVIFTQNYSKEFE